MEEAKIQFKVNDDSTLLIETEIPENAEDNDISLISNTENEERIIQSNKKFEEVAKGIAPITNVILDSLKEINSPKEIQLEFGVKIDFASNILIAKASSSANFKIMLKWENKDETKPT